MKKLILGVLVLALAFSLAAPLAAQAKKPLKIAFVYIGPPGDMGWTYEQDRGRLAAVQHFGSKIETNYVENVPEGPDAERVIRQLALQGFGKDKKEGADMIFTTSFGYMDPTFAVAKDFPKVIFEHCSGYKTAPNMATYFGRIEEARYLTGIIAGRMTKSNIIGYAAAFPIPEVVRGINGFTLGVRSVNPKAQVKVVWTNTWYDPVKEREAAVALLDEGADIIAQHQDTTEPQKAAQERGKYSIGYDSDMGKFVGDSVLASAVWEWSTYYIDTIQKALDGTWKTHEYWGGLKDGVAKLSSISPKVPASVVAEVEAAKKKILGGWSIFSGPLKDQGGKVVYAAGQVVPDGAQLGMDWFVEGVVGKVQ
ncbi:MAG: BMP family ABC transporter substrate-binding protein [Spirochaetia bacterium]|nr:BMP family ABC transporter substrate-binding protein [Spirochaetales bacterium]MDX9784031.1 BMP family ABC transporter substrate-binding protein [Spirochaetia bacterium]